MKTLVLFIHGLGGGEKTWQQFIALAKDDNELNEEFAFEMFTYDTSVFGFGANLSEVAALLRSDLHSKYRDYSNIVLITHSQGGLIAEKYLEEEVKSGQELRVVLLMTYAMPRAGSLLARFAPGTQTKQLRGDSDFMRGLNSDWETLEMAKRVRLVRVDGTADAVINQPHLAEFDNRNVTKARGGHGKVVRPDSRETDSYIHFKQALIDIKSVTEQAKPSTFTKMGVESAPAPPVKSAYENDARKSLMILPFEDLSPAHDNAWFADGIATELIADLSPIKSLRVADQEATKNYKRYQGELPSYAKEMSIRYFVEGSVRKFGEQIKIDVTLLDIETGDHLWQDSMRGTMNDIFDIQESVAAKVVEGLKVYLAPDEKKKLAERGTENAEAYELFLKADEYFKRQTKEGFQLAIQLYSEAIKLDSGYANAYSEKAHAITALYRRYDRNPALLDEGLQLVTEALRLKPGHWRAYQPLSVILQLHGKLEKAEQTAKEYIRNAPEDYNSYYTLGFFYFGTGQYAKAIGPYEHALELSPENLTVSFNLVLCCNEANEDEKVRHWAGEAILIIEKHLKLFPDDEPRQVNHAVLLQYAGRVDEARETARRLENLKDGSSLYNISGLQCMLEDYEAAIKTFRKAIEAGYRNIRLLKESLYDEDRGIGKLKGTADYEEVREMVASLEVRSG